MSQSYTFSDYSQHQYYSDSYDSANAMHTPIQHNQFRASAYDYQGEYNTGVTPSAQPVDDSSTLVQTYTYSNYAADTSFTPYDSAPSHAVSHYPDSVNQIPQQGVPQYGNAAPGQNWTGPAQYAEDTTVQPNDLHDQRRGSCASMTTDGSGWYSQDGVNDEHYDYAQPPPAQQEQEHHMNHYQHQHQHQHQQDPESMNYGMYSPTQYSRTQELARNAPFDATNQWAPPPSVPQGGLEAPYGTLPIHESKIHYEHQPSDAYPEFDDGSANHHPAHASPSTPSYPSAEAPPVDSLTGEASLSKTRDLYIQQRQAASYQQELQVQQARKYQQSGHLEQFEANQRRQDNFVHNQNYNYTAAHDTPQHQNHPAYHQRQSSSMSNHHLHRLVSAPIVPSQARERAAPCAQAIPEVEEKKESLLKKPALACLFCRKRKIACGPPSPDNPERTCNQCLRRKQTCEYPTESRRGIRKTPKEPVREEPTVHKFVHGDASSHEGAGPSRTRARGRRKRASA